VAMPWFVTLLCHFNAEKIVKIGFQEVAYCPVFTKYPEKLTLKNSKCKKSLNLQGL